MDHPAIETLRAAFDAADRAGAPLRVWWRDDDAVDATPALADLFGLAARHGAPLALAAIPSGATPALFAAAAADGHAILQHGVSHTNHQREGKSAELGDARPVDAIVEDCLAARARLADAPTFLPVMVPPWNRMRDDLAPALAAAGWTGVSRWGGAPETTPLVRIDTHIDPIAWRSDRALLPAEALVTMVRDPLATGGPIGLLTHHLVHTAEVTAFVDAFAGLVAAHPGATWASPAQLFGAPQ